MIAPLHELEVTFITKEFANSDIQKQDSSQKKKLLSMGLEGDP